MRVILGGRVESKMITNVNVRLTNDYSLESILYTERYDSH